MCCTMCVFRVMACAIVSGALCMEPGAKHKPVKSNTSPTITMSKIDDSRNETVFGLQGDNVTLTCSNRTWSELLYVIWKITVSPRACEISHSDRGQNFNTCDGGKALLNTSSGEPYLLIPRFSLHDEGLYRCEAAYRGTAGNYVNIHLVLSVPPSVTAWREWRGGRWVAVCLARGGKPAATLTWRTAGNLTTPTTAVTNRTLNPLDGSITVRSTLDLPEDGAMDNVTCAVAHLSWEKELTIRPVDSGAESVRVLFPALLICAAAVLATLAALYFSGKNRTAIRHCWQAVCRSPQEAPTPATDDVEELEPYASYVQRVNSLYSSSADLLK